MENWAISIHVCSLCTEPLGDSQEECFFHFQGRWQNRRILSSSHPKIYLENLHVSVNNPENVPQTDRTDSSQLNVEKRQVENGREVRNMVKNKTDPWIYLGEGGTWQAPRRERKRLQPRNEGPTLGG